MPYPKPNTDPADYAGLSLQEKIKLCIKEDMTHEFPNAGHAVEFLLVHELITPVDIWEAGNDREETLTRKDIKSIRDYFLHLTNSDTDLAFFPERMLVIMIANYLLLPDTAKNH